MVLLEVSGCSVRSTPDKSRTRKLEIHMDVYGVTQAVRILQAFKSNQTMDNSIQLPERAASE